MSGSGEHGGPQTDRKHFEAAVECALVAKSSLLYVRGDDETRHACAMGSLPLWLADTDIFCLKIFNFGEGSHSTDALRFRVRRRCFSQHKIPVSAPTPDKP